MNPVVLLSSTSANAPPNEVPPALRRAIVRHLAHKTVRSAVSSLAQKRMQERARALHGPKA